MDINNSNVYIIGEYRFVNFSQLNNMDVNRIRVWRNDISIRKFMYNSNIISEEEHLNFIQSLATRKDKAYWLVYLNDCPLGVVGIVDINYEKKCGEIGYYLLPDEQESGKGLDFLFSIYNFMFNSIGCSYLVGRTEIHNINALALNYYLGGDSADSITILNGIKYVEFIFKKESFMKAFENKSDSQKLIKFLKDIKPQLKLKYKT